MSLISHSLILLSDFVHFLCPLGGQIVAQVLFPKDSRLWGHELDQPYIKDDKMTWSLKTYNEKRFYTWRTYALIVHGPSQMTVLCAFPSLHQEEQSAFL